MAKDEDGLEPSLPVGKIPIIGEGLEAIVRFVLALRLFFLDPKGWATYIEKDRYALRSIGLLSVSFLLTYPVMRLTVMHGQEYSQAAVAFTNVFFMVLMGVLTALFTLVFGARVGFIRIVAGLAYITTMMMPLYWIKLTLIALLVGTLGEADTSWQAQVIVAITLGGSGLVFYSGLVSLSELTDVAKVWLFLAAVLGVLGTAAALAFAGPPILDLAENAAKTIENLIKGGQGA